MAASTGLVIFGASGALAGRKVLPALSQLAGRDGLPGSIRVIGAGRSDLGTEEFRRRVAASGAADGLASTAEWVRVDYDDPESYAPLREAVKNLGTVVFYLATPPETFTPIVQALAGSGLVKDRDPTRRIVVEKPLGSDLASARALNQELAEAFDETQIFRIDHYLAKDTVQNVLAFRFSNSVFEPIWNRTQIESIQITAAEDEGIGARAGYYDRIGATRDMIQNHVLQLLALVTMEPPTTFDPEDIRLAKIAALRAVQPIDPTQAVRGQYDGYTEEEGVDPFSRRETFAAARITIENWRWEGVPIYVRTGKSLRRRVTELIVRFRDAPHLRVGGHRQRGIPTVLVIRIQPEEAIILRIGAKRPGSRFEMVPAGMRLEYARLARTPLPDAYVHVLSEVLAGGHTVFPSGEEIERSWQIVDPLLHSWEQEGHPEVYTPGSWGPGASDDLVSMTGGGRWINSGDEPGTM